MFAFSEPNLDPYRISPFLNEFAAEVLITGRQSEDVLPTAVSSSSTLKHMGIVHLRWTGAAVQVKRFQHLHPTSRPNGARFPLQCPDPKCVLYYPWKIPPRTKNVLNVAQSFRCIRKGCKGVFKVPSLEGYRPLRKDLAQVYAITT